MNIGNTFQIDKEYFENQGWTYVSEYRRYKGNRHQLYMGGEWIDVNFKFNESNPLHEQ